MITLFVFKLVLTYYRPILTGEIIGEKFMFEKPDHT